MYYLKTEKSLKDIDNNIKEMFFQVFPNMNESEFVWEKEQKDYEEWDSFSQLTLITMLEEIFDIEISDDDAMDLKSAYDMRNFVERNK